MVYPRRISANKTARAKVSEAAADGKNTTTVAREARRTFFRYRHRWRRAKMREKGGQVSSCRTKRSSRGDVRRILCGTGGALVARRRRAPRRAVAVAAAGLAPQREAEVRLSCLEASLRSSKVCSLFLDAEVIRGSGRLKRGLVHNAWSQRAGPMAHGPHLAADLVSSPWLQLPT